MEAHVRHRTEVHMTEGDPRRVIVSFALPVLLSQLFQQLYSTADTWIVGHFRGTEALAAVSSSGSLTFLMISFFVGTSMGAGVVISRYFGARESEKTSRAVHTTVLLSLIMGAFLTAFGVAATPVLLRWMGTDPDVLPQSIIYFRYIFLGSIPMVMYNSLRGIMSAVGDSRRPLYYLILSSVLNILLDALFVGVFRWGVWAAAVATALSQAVSAVLCLIQLMKKGNVYTLSADRMRIDRDEFHHIISLEQAFVAVTENQQLGGHVSEKMEHMRSVNQVSAIMGVLGAHPHTDHRFVLGHTGSGFTVRHKYNPRTGRAYARPPARSPPP